MKLSIILACLRRNVLEELSKSIFPTVRLSKKQHTAVVCVEMLYGWQRILFPSADFEIEIGSFALQLIRVTISLKLLIIIHKHFCIRQMLA